MWGEREEYIPFLSDFFPFKQNIAITLLSDMLTYAYCNA